MSRRHDVTLTLKVAALRVVFLQQRPAIQNNRTKHGGFLNKTSNRDMHDSEISNQGGVNRHHIYFDEHLRDYTMNCKTLLRSSIAVAALAFATNAAHATVIEVTVTTNGPVGLAPVFAAFHDGGYDIFDAGGTASAGLELLAEVGDASAIIGEANTAGYTNVAAFAPGGPFAPNGGTGSMIFTLDAGDTSFSLASMLLPSNDWFIGTDNALNITSLLGADEGTFLSVPLSRVYDAGTESEEFGFAPGGGLVGITTPSNPAGGTTLTDPISMVTGPDPFSTFGGLEPVDFDTTTIDFTGSRVATLTLMVVPEPAATSLMLGLGLLGLIVVRRRK